MTVSFVDFASQQEAKKSIAENVLKNTYLLIEALKQNYVDYSIRSHQHNIERGENVEYHRQQIDELKNSDCPIDFVIDSGRKYHKIVFINSSGSKSVHCFIDKNTGEVYKSATWKSPAKGVRYDLRLIKDREYLLENADWAGSYLYSR